jgi:hypothetical protein
MITMHELLEEFSAKYDVKQEKEGKALLCIMTTGGGMSISGLGIVPGASNRLAGIYQPYSMDELWEFVKPALEGTSRTKEDWRSVHADSALFYLEALKKRHPGKYFYVAATAALETTRRRRGENVVYIALRRPDGSEACFKVLFAKWEDVNIGVWYKDGVPIQETPEEVWNKTFLHKDGEPNLHILGCHRRAQDRKVAAAILALILNDPENLLLSEGDSITQLTDGAEVVENVWATGD